MLKECPSGHWYPLARWPTHRMYLMASLCLLRHLCAPICVPRLYRDSESSPIRFSSFEISKSVEAIRWTRCQIFKISSPSGINVTEQPPPPAPVSLVLRPNGGADVFDLIFSKTGWDTPSVTKCSWFLFIRAC
jgi:hypothetical protein